MADPTPSDADRRTTKRLVDTGTVLQVQVFDHVKALLRTRAARDLESLLAATAQTLDAFTPADCLHFLHHARYATN